MPTSPGSERRHNNQGADPELLAEFAEENYAELRLRRDRHAGADRRIPLDPLADALANNPQQHKTDPQEVD